MTRKVCIIAIKAQIQPKKESWATSGLAQFTINEPREWTNEEAVMWAHFPSSPNVHHQKDWRSSIPCVALVHNLWVREREELGNGLFVPPSRNVKRVENSILSFIPSSLKKRWIVKNPPNVPQQMVFMKRICKGTVIQTRAVALKCISQKEAKIKRRCVYVWLFFLNRRIVQHILLQAIRKECWWYRVESVEHNQNGVDKPFFDCRLLNRCDFLGTLFSYWSSPPKLAWLLLKWFRPARSVTP